MKKRAPKLSPPETVVLRGGITLSTGTAMAVEVRIYTPYLTRKEERELEAATIVLHDLTPDPQPRKRK